MTYSKKLLMLLICVTSLCLKAETNVLPKISNPLEDKSILDLAWSPYNYFHTPKGYIVIKEPLILKAKLDIFDWFFMDHPYNNRFQEILRDFESELHDKDHKYNRLKARNIFFVVGGIGGGIIIGILTGKAFVYFKNKQ